jgi:GNAT superfamily N-acetyltransferase
MGTVFADSQTEPAVALAVIDFCLLAGDPGHRAAVSLLRMLKPGAIAVAPTPEWERLLAATYPGTLVPYPREAFEPGEFDVNRLRQFRDELRPEFALRRIGLAEVPQFATDLHPALVYNFRSHEEFIARGIGWGILHDGVFVAGASSAAIGGGRLEIEIQTHPRFRRRGLATAVAAALILHALEHGLEPCWDAANEPSSALARKLGFRSTGKYNAHVLPPTASKSGGRRS